MRVENEGGTWLGRLDGFDASSGAFDMTMLEGQGNYAGLMAPRFVTSTTVAGMGAEEVEEGVIFDFAQPAQPGLPTD